MVEWSVEALRASESVRSIVVACPPGHVHELGGHDLGVVDGGATRAESVSRALAAVGTELVAIHDAARPLVTPQLVEDVVATLVGDEAADGAIAAAPVVDTVKRAARGEGRDADTSGRAGSGTPEPAGASPSGPNGDASDAGGAGALAVGGTLDRRELWAAQTPQVFRTEALRRALEQAGERAADATDEAMLIEWAGGRVLIHPAPPENVKVTTPLDLRIAEQLLADRGA
jgi:2-C-methyl-D-erythritol 4-phosphate cytidylyltransferase